MERDDVVGKDSGEMVPTTEKTHGEPIFNNFDIDFHLTEEGHSI
jgi:hypothetical protein